MTGNQTAVALAEVATQAWDADGSSLDWLHNDAQEQLRAGQLRHACVFELSGTTYALDVAVVSEVFTPDLLTPVPLAPAGFLGLCNLRGTALAITDLAAVLGTASKARGDAMSPVLVLRFPDLTVGVTIARVVEIRGYRDGDLLPTQNPRADDPVRGYLRTDADARADGALITVLRPEFVRARLETLRLRRDRDISAAD